MSAPYRPWEATATGHPLAPSDANASWSTRATRDDSPLPPIEQLLGRHGDENLAAATNKPRTNNHHHGSYAVPPRETPVPLPNIPGYPRAAQPQNQAPLHTNASQTTSNHNHTTLSPTNQQQQQQPAKPASRKRKSDVVEEPSELLDIDDDDPRLYQGLGSLSCNQVRRNLRNIVESGTMKVGELQKAIDCSSASYQRFMKQNGPDRGMGSDVYQNACVFFRKRELQGLKAAPAKKVKKGEESKDLDVSGVELEGEKDQTVRVHDTCDEVRKKINAFLRKPGVTNAAFCREIAKNFPADRKIQSKQLNDFLSKKGPRAGNTSCVFYGAYVFFEKRRIKDKKPKSQMRLDTEKNLPGGMNVTDVQNWITCFPGEMPVEDKFGRVEFAPTSRRTPYIPRPSF